ncbi:MAG: hypothetical protein DWQ36_21885 [Acidobacteria bacterium]|nr:MAG: hypothetical protein DWQ30_00655 [Acidobacteriota bacterium]REK00841.1 MAG: hypothetical protein DWQ36_21885 [Acidobacteriota bacterium]
MKARRDLAIGAGLAATWALTALVAAPASAQHDCIPYTPTEAGTTINSNWAVPGEQDDYQIVIPDDPGGGYVIASVSTSAPSEPMMRIIPPSGQGVVTDIATTTNGPSPHTLTVAFEVDADTTFDVEIIEDTVAPIDQHPVAYTWTWTFVSQVDCYEPNDGSPSSWPDPSFDAREIPLDQELTAYAIAGHQASSIPNDADHSWDWYELTLGAPTDLWLATTKIPDDQRLRMRLYPSDGPPAIASGTSSVAGDEISFGPVTVPAGTWYLEIHPIDNGEEDARLSEGESLPDHFITPYRWVVSTAPIADCGFMAIFCDGFESGDTTLWSTSVP